MIAVLGLTPTVQQVWRFRCVDRGEVNRTDACLDWPSGKGTNAARVARALGSPVRLIVFAGGASGDFYLRAVAREGIAAIAVPTRAATRYATTILETEGAIATELVQNGQPVETDEAGAARRAFLDGLEGVRVAVLTGTVPAGVDPDLYADLVRAADARGIPAVVDAQGDLLLRALEARPLVAKPNRRELLRALDRAPADENAYLDALREARARGARWIAASEGARGVILIGEGCALRFTPPAIRPLNPIGSGDAMAGGIAHGIRAGLDVPDAVRLGVACGTANALTLRNGEVRVDDVEALRRTVEVEEIR
ncbi:MAG: hexose kinase [Planctomycetes bacterium]|nr:hexose kinase [Planctomycetota bacterium]